jgi:iduronate 2-sulfatase
VSDTAYIDGKLVDMAIKDLRKLKKNKKKFFMAVGFRKPHLPFTAPKKYWDLYDREQFDFPENYVVNETNIPMNAFHNSDELRAYKGVPPSGPVSDSMAITMHGYYACISYVDNLIGKLLGELHDLGLDENTIIVMIGDHGWNLGEHGMWCKHCNFNTSFHSLMTVNVPGINTRGVTNSITEFVDIFPTLCELCDLPELEQLEGESFVEVLKDPDYEVKDHAVARWREGITLINKEYFYTEWRDKNDEMYERMLFDHSVDPDENINIVNLKENSELVDSLHTKLMNSRGTSYYK